MSFKKYLDISREIKEAIDNGLPIVALESTIISHGMPYPSNVEMAQKTEEIIRKQGAIPATIAIMDGKIKIGLNSEELLRLAKAVNVRKVSRRDLAITLAKKEIGATTVASTMICANMAGIKFFVTGGIGGVHRGYEKTLDVSADLEELAMTDVNVICAGAKAILDLPRTMEYLETKGVSVIGYQTKVLPAFYTRKSNIALNDYVESIDELASILLTKEELNLKGGTLIVNPILKEDSLDEKFINKIIDSAIEEGFEKGIEGKNVTPFLLSRIVEETKGESLKANIALVYNNARIGAKLAAAFHNKKVK